VARWACGWAGTAVCSACGRSYSPNCSRRTVRTLVCRAGLPRVAAEAATSPGTGSRHSGPSRPSRPPRLRSRLVGEGEIGSVVGVLPGGDDDDQLVGDEHGEPF
jgi:hypothetical protein